MLFEYLGIPGSGKTYYANKYKEQLTKDGKSFLDISRKKKMPLWLKIFYKLAEMFLLKFPKYQRQIKEYERICKQSSPTPKFLPFSLDYCIKDIVLASLLHDVFNRNDKIFINDEGLLQRIVFLIVQYDISFDKIWAIYKNRRNVKTCYIDLDVETAFRNIRNRNRHVCPMDEMDDENLKAYLQDCLYVCNRIKEMMLLNKESKADFAVNILSSISWH